MKNIHLPTLQERFLARTSNSGAHKFLVKKHQKRP